MLSRSAGPKITGGDAEGREPPIVIGERGTDQPAKSRADIHVGGDQPPSSEGPGALSGTSTKSCTNRSHDRSKQNAHCVSGNLPMASSKALALSTRLRSRDSHHGRGSTDRRPEQFETGGPIPKHTREIGRTE